MASDPLIKVGIHVPASLLQLAQTFARSEKTNVSELCRAGLARELGERIAAKTDSSTDQ